MGSALQSSKIKESKLSDVRGGRYKVGLVESHSLTLGADAGASFTFREALGKRSNRTLEDPLQIVPPSRSRFVTVDATTVSVTTVFVNNKFCWLWFTCRGSKMGE